MISPFKIKWRSYSSLDFDVWTELAFGQGDGGEIETFLSKEAVASESYDGSFRRAYGYKYTESPIFTLTFIKKNYDDFTRDENRKILAWLTGSKSASFMDVYTEDSERPEFCCLGNFTNVNQYKMGSGRIVGYTAEFESLTPYCFSPLWSVTSIMPNVLNQNLTVYEWYNGESSNVGSPYYYTIDSTLKHGTMMFRYNGSGDVTSYSQLQPWKQIQNIQDVQASKYVVVAGGSTLTLQNINQYSFQDTLGMGIVLDVQTDEAESVVYPKITFQLNSDNYIRINFEPTEVIAGFVYYNTSNSMYYWKDKSGQIRSAYSPDASGITDIKIMFSNTYVDADGEPHVVTSEIAGNKNKETIVLDGANKVIASDRVGGRIFGDDFDWNWIAFMNGINTLSVLGNCTITVEWREPIKVGQYC